jgi:hypothetical protein
LPKALEGNLPMPSFPEIYPPRERSTNVALIKGLIAAQNQQEFEAADQRVAQGLHPSLLAELDWMEMSMPAQQRAGGARLADGLFIHHLPAILAQRRAELDVSDEELRWEISAHLHFYSNLIQDEQRPLDSLGESLSQRIQNCIQTIEPDTEGVLSRMRDAERPRIAAVFSGLETPDWIPLMVDVEIKNALAKSLDHASSRMQTKQFVRHIGTQFPNLNIFSMESGDDLQLLLQRLGELEALAREWSVYRLAAVCGVLREALAEVDATRFGVFGGEIAAGYGGCGTCSMMYASTSMVSYDPTCPRLFQAGGDRILLPIDFNVSVCPFCGEEARAEAPSMFYSPGRNLVIYNCPQLGQFSEDQARDVHRPALTNIRQTYIERISAEEAAKFEQANEEFTYSAAEFLVAIQMGTTVKEQHVFNITRFPDGSGCIVDTTKGVIIGLTRREMESRWVESRAGRIEVAPDDPGSEGGAGMKEAMAAFASGQYERSRDILEALHQKFPGDEAVRKNLAAAYVTLGDKESARRVLAG